MCCAHLLAFLPIQTALISYVRDRSAAMQKMAFWTLPLELTSRWKLVFASTSISIAQTCCPSPPGVLCAFARILTDPNRSDQLCARSFHSNAKDGILDADAGTYFSLEACVRIHFHIYSPNLLSFTPGVLCAFARILTDPNRSDQLCARLFRSNAISKMVRDFFTDFFQTARHHRRRDRHNPRYPR